MGFPTVSDGDYYEVTLNLSRCQMPIETNNLVLYKSERLTDTSDGGGKYSGQLY
jgi:hypothetical protein